MIAAEPLAPGQQTDSCIPCVAEVGTVPVPNHCLKPKMVLFCAQLVQPREQGLKPAGAPAMRSQKGGTGTINADM